MVTEVKTRQFGKYTTADSTYSRDHILSTCKPFEVIYSAGRPFNELKT